VIYGREMDHWDICAGDALIKAMKGRSSDINGEIINYEDGSTKSNGLLMSL
jgi:3'-phosphoadenosine 5'-phosphosulfate (PAPS) 3'-phosphatase